MTHEEKAFWEAAGVSVKTPSEFLGLSPAQEAVVETKVRLSALLRATRREQGLSQAALAQKLNLPQQNVARMEKGDRSVTIDLLLRALLGAGVSLEEIGQEIARGGEQLRRESGAASPSQSLGETLSHLPQAPAQLRLLKGGLSRAARPAGFHSYGSNAGVNEPEILRVRAA